MKVCLSTDPGLLTSSNSSSSYCEGILRTIEIKWLKTQAYRHVVQPPPHTHEKQTQAYRHVVQPMHTHMRNKHRHTDMLCNPDTHTRKKRQTCCATHTHTRNKHRHTDMLCNPETHTHSRETNIGMQTHYATFPHTHEKLAQAYRHVVQPSNTHTRNKEKEFPANPY